MHQQDSDGIVRSCTPLVAIPSTEGLTESAPLQIESVTFYNSNGRPLLVRERWTDNGKEFEQWFHLTDALAFVEGRN